MSATGQQNEQASEPQLCAQSCGFFANMGCGGMCSKCHREHMADLERKMKASAQPVAQQVATTSSSVQAQKPQVPSPSPAPQPAPESSAPTCSSFPAPEQPSTSGDDGSTKVSNRCFECRKRVGLTGFKCKCNNMFCGQHRYAESHNCPFDYKGTQRQKLAESNPVVQASKVQKI